MRLRAYKATGAGISALTRLLGFEFRVTGTTRLPDRPTLFVANHFTRFETFVMPWLIWHRFGRPVRSLATHHVFGGKFGRYLRSLGAVSTRDPMRNHMIIGDLMTGRRDWLIYPEGGLVKNKKTIERGRLRLDRDGRVRPPHTGAAMMALKAEIGRRRYLEACATDDLRRRGYYEERYDLAHASDVAPQGPVLVPVSITYPSVRSGRNVLERVARLLAPGMDPRLAEELLVEGTLLLHEREISVHFGRFIEVGAHLDRATDLARRMVALFKGDVRDDVLLRRQARRLTESAMRAIYGGVEVNLEHLFCAGLRALRSDRVPADRFHRALCLAAIELRRHDDVRLHPALHNGIVGMTRRRDFPRLDRIVRLAEAEGVVRRDGDDYVIDRTRLDAAHDHHTVRLDGIVQVIANELEPVVRAAGIVGDTVNLDDDALARRLPDAVHASDVGHFRRAYERHHRPGASLPRAYGEPFFLEAPNATAGIVLAHGYLSCPQQVRPLAEHLHACGYSVYGARLEGHGTAPRNLIEVRWADWLESLAQAHAVVANRCPRVVLGGFSLGGLIALLLASELGDDAAAVFAVNAPLRLRHPLAPLVPAVLRFNRAVRRVRRSDAGPRGRRNRSESADVSYDRDFLHGIHELRRAMFACRRRLADVVAPTLVIQSDEDPIVHPRSAEILDLGLGAQRRTVVRVHDRRHVIVRGDGCERVFDPVSAFLGEVLAETFEVEARYPSVRRIPGVEGSPDGRYVPEPGAAG